MDIVIHVGFHKTGTTWLQNEVFSKMDDAYYLHNFDLDTLLPETDKPIIISCEWLTGKPHMLDPSDKMYAIANRLKKCFPKAKIIVGERKKNSWLKSLWKQHVMEGGTYNYDQFLRNVDKGFLEFDKYEEHLRELFDDVFIYHFDDLKKNKKCVVKDLSEYIGVDEPDWEDVTYRKSMSDKKINHLRLINRCIPENIKKRFYVTFIKDIAGSWEGK